MKKVIGGLLVVSMLSAPHVLGAHDLNYLAYEMLRNSRVYYVQVRHGDDDAVPKDIDLMMASMEENSRQMSGLFKERANTMGRIEATMDLMSHAKRPLTERQMAEFSEFMRQYDETDTDIRGVMQKISQSRSLTMAQQEILKEDTDFNELYAQLSEVLDYQNTVIENLNTVCSRGSDVIKMFYEVSV